MNIIEIGFAGIFNISLGIVGIYGMSEREPKDKYKLISTLRTVWTVWGALVVILSFPAGESSWFFIGWGLIFFVQFFTVITAKREISKARKDNK